MRPIYTGDASNVRKRLRHHLSGNVEASALRKHIAVAKGFTIQSTTRESGSRRQRLDLPDPRRGEREISHYIRMGTWRLILCNDHAEARDFQWYLIEQLNPALNVDRRGWDEARLVRYSYLEATLLAQPMQRPDEIRVAADGPGVYVLFHDMLPHEHETET